MSAFGKPWYQHTLADGIIVDEAQPGNIYMVGQGTQPVVDNGIFGALNISGDALSAGGSGSPSGKEAETNKPITSTQISKTVARPTTSLLSKQQAVLVSAAVAQKAAALKLSRQAYYDSWRAYAPGSPLEHVAAGMDPGGPFPTQGGTWHDYYVSLMYEMRLLSARLPFEYFGYCKRDDYKISPQAAYGGGKVLFANRPKCVESQIKYGVLTAWGKKARAAMVALIQSGQDPRPLVGGLAVGVYDLVDELARAQEKLGFPHAVQATGLPTMSQQAIQAYLRKTLLAAQADASKLSKLKLLGPAAGLAAGARVVSKTPQGTASATDGPCPGGYKLVAMTAEGPQCAPDTECPADSVLDPETGQCVQLDMSAGEEDYVLTDEAKNEKASTDYGTYALYAGIGVVALGGIYMLTRKKKK